MASTKKLPQVLDPRFVDLVQQALETEIGGIEIYRTALRCATNPTLREEWKEYLAQTERHVAVLRDLCATLGIDPALDTPGRQVVRTIGKALCNAMHLALGSVPPAAAEVVAAECVTLAETKDHLNWSLLAKLADASEGNARTALADAVADVEHEEDEHLYHTSGWTRELWLESLGLPAQLPPPDKEQDVRTMAEAAQVKASRRPPTR